ncbi:MAG: DUF2807 domain-containing protein [Cyclobacteriaceae bacterium]|nr:DUF2807 domain-containing protein [Cyclobacteriaceae bacterium]
MKKLSILALLLLVQVFVFAQNRETRSVDTFTKISFRVPGKLYLRQGSPQKVELEGSADVLREIETDVDGGRLSIGKEGRWMNWNWNDRDKIIAYVTVKDIEAISVSGSGDLIGQGKFTTNDLDLKVSGSGSMEIEATASGNLEADVSGSGDLSFKGSCANFESDVSGSGKVMISSIAVRDDADMGVSGSGKIIASGTARSVKANISGSGQVLAANLETDKCEVRISGSGDVEINVKSDLDANISGSGSVTYKGSPSRVNSHSSGSGKVRKM